MTSPSRRRFIEGLAALAAWLVSMPSSGQQSAPANRPAGQAGPVVSPFGYEDVIRRARELAGSPFDPAASALPEPLAKLDFDAWRDIRFRADKALLAGSGGPFRMQMFHPGFLFKHPVTVNIVREGLATPVPYSSQLFDYGRNKFDKPLPVNLGFAGFRLHYPLNDPKTYDELIAFLGASYFRFLGRGQRYGLSARGLAIDAGGQEEFPFFREFWVEQPDANASRAVIYALLDSPSIAGAYQFLVYPDRDSVMEVTATLFARKPVPRLGIAPLTSMFFTGEYDRRFYDDYRPELHDSDGLLIHSGSGEWLWRPLRNPVEPSVSAFMDKSLRGFGLIQRDRVFEHYQDLDLAYERRPSYWIEPDGDWGEGHVELVELPTGDETNDNIVASWIPKQVAEPGQTITYRYRIRAMLDTRGLNPGGRAINSYKTKARALGSAEPEAPGTRRFIIDFADGDLAYFLGDPGRVQIDASTSAGRIARTYLVPNPQTQGFRAGLDVVLDPGQSGDLRVFLKSGNRALTETWTIPWKAE
jgi:periplasmic glucans biosynthesis protein